MENRRFDLDNLKGILILLVVYGHLLFPVALKQSGISYEVSSFIYFFHMPAFLFVSGLLTKNVEIKEYIKKVFLLYFVFNFSLSLFDFYINGAAIDFIHPYYSMWYLIVVLVGRILISINDSPVLFLISLIFSLFSGFSPADNTFALSRIIGFMPFFLFGYFLSKKNIFEFKDSGKIKNIYHIVPLLFFFYIVYVFTLRSDLGIDFYTFSSFNSYYEFIFRLVLIFINFGLILSMFFVIPNKKIPILSTIGKNSLTIYLLHRFITLLFEKVFLPDKTRVFISIFVSVIICVVLGSSLFNNVFEKFILFVNKKKYYVYFFLGLFILTSNISLIIDDRHFTEYDLTSFDNSVKISYVGDMILFENDLYKAKKDDTYDFSKYFEGVSDFLGDYTFGVFEGVLSEDELVSSNYLDRKDLKLLYPTDFADEIKKNVDFVNICTNHILDGGEEKLDFTRKYLDDINLDYADGTNIKIVDIEGIKFAVLAYSYGSNYGELDSSQKIVDKQIIEDFKNLENYSFDKILVFAHTGTEFSHEKDYNQDYYGKLFSSLGADVVYFDHSHNTEPVEFIGDCIVFNGAGNFSSSYTDKDCDKGAICNIYIDKTSKEIFLTSIVPIKSIVSEDDVTYPAVLYKTGDIASSNTILKSMIGMEFPYVLKEAFFNKEYGFVTNIEKDVFLDEGTFSGDTFFMGDSITFGYENGIPFYGAIDFEDVSSIYNLSGNGWTSTDLLKAFKDVDKEELMEYDNFVIAIGANDIRYLGKDNELLKNLEDIIKIIPSGKKIYIISPWFILDGDLLHIIDIDEIDSVYCEINEDLKDFCKERDIVYLNLNSYIQEHLDFPSRYMVDYIHPNEDGIKLYSESFVYNLKNIK